MFQGRVGLYYTHHPLSPRKMCCRIRCFFRKTTVATFIQSICSFRFAYSETRIVGRSLHAAWHAKHALAITNLTVARWRSRLARSRSCSCCLKAPMLLAEDEGTQFRAHPVVESCWCPIGDIVVRKALHAAKAVLCARRSRQQFLPTEPAVRSTQTPRRLFAVEFKVKARAYPYQLIVLNPSFRWLNPYVWWWGLNESPCWSIIYGFDLKIGYQW